MIFSNTTFGKPTWVRRLRFVALLFLVFQPTMAFSEVLSFSISGFANAQPSGFYPPIGQTGLGMHYWGVVELSDEPIEFGGDESQMFYQLDGFSRLSLIADGQVHIEGSLQGVLVSDGVTEDVLTIFMVGTDPDTGFQYHANLDVVFDGLTLDSNLPITIWPNDPVLRVEAAVWEQMPGSSYPGTNSVGVFMDGFAGYRVDTVQPGEYDVPILPWLAYWLLGLFMVCTFLVARGASRMRYV